MKHIKWLLLVPFIGMLGFLPLANRIEPYVFGLPFLLFWIVLWILLSFVILAVVYILDPDNKEGGVE